MADFTEFAILLIRNIKEKAKKQEKMTVSTKVKVKVAERYSRK